MPRYDGTGPAGQGPMSGQGLGYCLLRKSLQENGTGIRGYAGLGGRPVPAGYPATYAYRRMSFFSRRFPAGRFGLGFGRGHGRGCGRGRGWFMGSR
jgi:hypothetical protein